VTLAVARNRGACSRTVGARELTHDVASCEETRIRQRCGQHGDEELSSRNEEPTREQRVARRAQKIARLREQLEEKDRELDSLRARLVAGSSDRDRKSVV
jgi:hypothetical protein